MNIEAVIVLLLVFLEFCLGVNNRPIVGILTQPTDGTLEDFGRSYIAASYVKYLESAGGRVVPIFYNTPTDELDILFNSINGILFPGGGADLNNTKLYQTGSYLYQKVLQANDAGDYFPLLGHCMGFELLSMITSENLNILTPFDAENITLPLHLTIDAIASRWLGSAPHDVLEIITKQPVTMNNHNWGVAPSDWNDNAHLPKFYRILSTNKDRNGKEFISTIEGLSYPVYGAQWHAEKPQFEWNEGEVINHSSDAIFAMQYFANFILSEARKNTHTFPSYQAEYKAMIYNYNTTYTEQIESDFEQIYAFPK